MNSVVRMSRSTYQKVTQYDLSNRAIADDCERSSGSLIAAVAERYELTCPKIILHA